MAKNYKELNVWQKAMDIAVSIYRLTLTFPKDELFGLVSQMRRAAVSIASNIAEGEGRKSSNEFHHFLGIALGSISELETQIELSVRIGFTEKSEIQSLVNDLATLGKMLTALRIKLKTPTTDNRKQTTDN